MINYTRRNNTDVTWYSDISRLIVEGEMLIIDESNHRLGFDFLKENKLQVNTWLINVKEYLTLTYSHSAEIIKSHFPMQNEMNMEDMSPTAIIRSLNSTVESTILGLNKVKENTPAEPTDIRLL